MSVSAENVQLGMNCELKLKDISSSSASTATAFTAENVTDVTLNMTASEADVTTRGNSGWRQTVATLKEASVDFTILKIDNDPTFVLLKECFLNNDSVYASLGYAGTVSLAGNWAVTQFNEEQPLEDAVKISVTLKLTSIDND